MKNTDKPNKIKISAGAAEAEAELNSSGTAQAVWKALPFSSIAQRWGDEVYFSIPVSLEAESQKEVVDMGDLGYWPPGTAFCIFFGRTPVSRGNEIRPASPVNVFGKLTSSPEIFRKVKDGSPIKVERLIG
jgi:uncharacterized protein